MTNLLPKNTKTIAFVMSPRLGDALIAMVIVHNLRRSGYQVTVFSNYLFALKNWFPNDDIHAYPDEASGRKLLQTYDLLIHSYPHDVLFNADQWHPHVIILDTHPLYRRRLSMVDLNLCACREILGLTDVVRENGLVAPAGLQARVHKKRVAIHPTAALKNKFWLTSRFIKLAKKLQLKGFEPMFIVSPAEKKETHWIAENGLTAIENPSLDALARWLYESGWFVGNDSGIGHLASNLGIPTVTVMQRAKIRDRWRPSWAPGQALISSVPLIVSAWKERYWKYFISVNRVLQSLYSLGAQSKL